MIYFFQAVAKSPQFSKSLGSMDRYCDDGVVGDQEGYCRCGVEGDSTFIFTIVGEIGSSFLTLPSMSQYFMCHQHMPEKPLSILLSLCACLSSLFNCFKIPALSLILLIHLALNSSSFIHLHSAKSSSSRSARSYDIVSGWINWTTLSVSNELGRAKKYCWSSVSLVMWAIGSWITMFCFFE